MILPVVIARRLEDPAFRAEYERQLAKLKPCPACGYPEGLIYCPVCHGGKR